MKTIVALLVAACVAVPAAARDACESFKWDVSQEHRLFLGKPLRITATTSAAAAPRIEPNRLYELELLPQAEVRFASTPAKPDATGGALAGQVRVRLSKAGSWRIALGAPFWLDVAADGKLLREVDFSSSHGCVTPRKIVVYVLPANRDLVLQLGASTERSVQLSITPAP
jgi:hypothetical protein